MNLDKGVVPFSSAINMGDTALSLKCLGGSENQFCSDVSSFTDDGCRLVLGLGPTSTSYCFSVGVNNSNKDSASGFTQADSVLQLGRPAVSIDTFSGLDNGGQRVIPVVDEGSSSAKRSGGYMPSLLLDPNVKNPSQIQQLKDFGTGIHSQVSQEPSPYTEFYVQQRTSNPRKCKFMGCVKGARGASGLCISHGGGQRCQKPGCNKGAESKTTFCKTHGGGKRCEHLGCTKSAEGKTDFCISHGGGRRCEFLEGCDKAARGRSGLCIKHGGGKRCNIEDCTRSAEGQAGCSKGAEGSTPLSHGGGKRCSWGDGKCEKFARGKSGLCAAHNTIMSRENKDGSKSGLIGPGLFSGLVFGSTSDHSQSGASAVSDCTDSVERIQFENRQKNKKMMIPMQVLVPSSMKSPSNSHEGETNIYDFMVPEERVHGGGLLPNERKLRNTTMEFRGDANQRIARISAHLTPQMEAKNSVIGRENCRAKGGNPGFKVAILGAAGGIGQSLSLLMKMNPLVSLLHLYDVVNAPGVTADVSHMDTGAVVRGFLGAKQLEDALTGMDLVIIPAGIPRKPGMTRDDLFKINAGIVKTLCEGVAKCCPNAIVNLISNPVNSTVPIAAEVFKKAGTYDPKKLLGVTTLDVARANTFVAEVLGLDPREVDVPVVGGHAGVTILPLLSQVKPPSSFTPQEIEYLTNRIQNGGTEVVEAKAGAAKFADACLRGLRGDANVVECSFVASQVTELAFFATKVRLGRTGAEEVYQLGPLNEYERIGLEKAKDELAGSIQKGVEFIRK
ncbi:unnamed protein product [Arabidopsis thaliana]|uniref:malate dehydrogenase n=1 Tax=Arabidopsis thaliana TaxID=3702 RepID=A0A7G2FBF9_ARATH|nr:unnamed protein product [Arabidopsis thaliana]